jgi:predicted nucleotidyltransferase
MKFEPVFPTKLHQAAAGLVRDYFLTIKNVDTVLVVNSCARGQAIPESDLDFAILVTPGTSKEEIKEIENNWQSYNSNQSTILEYKKLNRFTHLHLDIIDGKYTPTILEIGAPADNFEIEIGNQICYSAPMGNAGFYFRELQKKWLPYYDEELRSERFLMIRNACEYDLEHISFFVKRGLNFHALDILFKAFQEYLQALFIAKRTYPIAYNKWIREQVSNWLNKPELYSKLSPVLSVSNIESNEINDKAKLLYDLLNNLSGEYLKEDA